MVAPISQKAEFRPIGFVLRDGGRFNAVSLKIRPEDLSRTETARASLHQTMGRDVTGWVDHFGEGLPSCTISGHTGWRFNYGMDGQLAFLALNKLVAKEYPAAIQRAINAGRSPDTVQLLFIDVLDGFMWRVVPMQFVLRRSKSSPLLFRYNINLQAVATQMDAARMIPLALGTISSGLSLMGGLLKGLR